ncbi:hypothetical protein V6N00_12845 [Tersicoccus sp. MR15.9]|uniref:hypothetical protein n=1 Tax=Tersicoccus mangrovi TaxID=3121635 RepID=UPI002FE6658C
MLLATRSVDARCQQIALDHLAGNVASCAARQQILAELHGARISETTARRPELGRQRVMDLRQEMDELLMVKTMQETPGGLDLGLIAEGTSACGWARNLLTSARPSLLRNLHTNTTARISLVDPRPLTPFEANAGEGPGQVWLTFHTATSAETYDEEKLRKLQTAADWLQSKQRGLRQNARVAANAASLQHGLGVPALVRPSLEERRRLHALLQHNPDLAWRSAVAMRDILDQEPVTRRVDEGFLDLWGDYAYTHLDDVASASPRVALVLVEAALTDRPRPARSVQRSFTAAVRALGSGVGWPRLAIQLTETYLALEFETTSSFDTIKGEEHRRQRAIGRRIAILRAPDVFERAIRHPDQRLGRTEAEITEQLDRLITSLTDSEVRAPDEPRLPHPTLPTRPSPQRPDQPGTVPELVAAGVLPAGPGVGGLRDHRGGLGADDAAPAVQPEHVRVAVPGPDAHPVGGDGDRAAGLVAALVPVGGAAGPVADVVPGLDGPGAGRRDHVGAAPVLGGRVARVADLALDRGLEERLAGWLDPLTALERRASPQRRHTEAQRELNRRQRRRLARQ